MSNLYTKTLKEAQQSFSHILAKPAIDAYVINIGVNDLKSEHPEESFKRLQDLIDRLLTFSNAKILVSLILPTTNNQKINDKIYDFNYNIREHTKFLRNDRGFSDRLFTIFNNAFFAPIDVTRDFYDDWIHLSPYGLRVHCSNIKHALLQAFNISVHSRAIISYD